MNYTGDLMAPDHVNDCVRVARSIGRFSRARNIEWHDIHENMVLGKEFNF